MVTSDTMWYSCNGRVLCQVWFTYYTLKAAKYTHIGDTFSKDFGDVLMKWSETNTIQIEWLYLETLPELTYEACSQDKKTPQAMSSHQGFPTPEITKMLS